MSLRTSANILVLRNYLSQQQRSYGKSKNGMFYYLIVPNNGGLSQQSGQILPSRYFNHKLIR